MKLKFTLLAMMSAFFLSGIAQESQTKIQASSEPYVKPWLVKQKSKTDNSSIAKQVDVESYAVTGYTPGETTDIIFSINLVNTDDEYGDLLELTFPAGFIINSVSNDDVFTTDVFGANPTAAYNGISGQTVSWGDDNNDFGGIPTNTEVVFSVNVTVAGNVSGDQVIDLFVSGDTYSELGPAGDFTGSITVSEGQTISQIVIESAIHETLEAAVTAAGLVQTLSVGGPFTLFAPTDDAFAALEASSPGIIDALLADPDGALTNVLLYHVVAGAALAADLSDGQVLTTLQAGGQTVTVSITGGNVFINDAQVIVADIEATNGVVHVIDAVLVPAEEVTIWTVVRDSEDHATLEAALLASGLDGVLNDIDVELTLFAPTDAAFDALETAAPGTIASLLADAGGALANVLLYHVVGGTALSTDLSNGLEVLTAQGSTVLVSITGGNVFINSAQVMVADIETENGVVHVIDAVLVPENCSVFNGGPYGNFNTAFGGAPVAENGVCPFNVITGFESWASEAYVINNFVEGTEYTFGLSGGGIGAWDVSLVVQNATTGEIVASEEGNSITWVSPTGGAYLIIIQEAGLCGGQSNNQSTDNGFPYITCSSSSTVVEIVVNSAIHNTLETAVIAAGLVETLNGEGPFTLFAPTDAAFEALEEGVLDALLADPTGDLTTVLTHHVVGGLAFSTDLSNGQSIPTLQGENVVVNIGASVTITSGSGNVATVTVTDIIASNGVVHVIDAVLIPGAIVSVQNFAGVSALNIYPNPSNNQFTVDLELINSDHVTIDLINLLGQNVKSFDYGNRSAGLNREYIDVNDLPEGFYLMNITVGRNQGTAKVQVIR